MIGSTAAWRFSGASWAWLLPMLPHPVSMASPTGIVSGYGKETVETKRFNSNGRSTCINAISYGPTLLNYTSEFDTFNFSNCNCMRIIKKKKSHPLYRGWTNTFFTNLSCSASSITFNLYLPASIRNSPIGGDRVLQWPAVNIHPAVIKLPPQMCFVGISLAGSPHCTDTCQGCNPFSASLPPTILVGLCANIAMLEIVSKRAMKRWELSSDRINPYRL